MKGAAVVRMSIGLAIAAGLDSAFLAHTPTDELEVEALMLTPVLSAKFAGLELAVPL